MPASSRWDLIRGYRVKDSPHIFNKTLPKYSVKVNTVVNILERDTFFYIVS